MGLMKQFFKPTFEKIKQVNFLIFIRQKIKKKLSSKSPPCYLSLILDGSLTCS